MEEAMAAAAHRPLLVKEHSEGYYTVHDISIENEQRLEVYPSSTPVVEPLHYRPLAVSPCAGAGDILLGVTPHQTSGGGVRHMGPPIMLAVGDDTVVRMDTVTYGDASRFEMLLLLAGGSGWRTVPLPRPPFRTLPSQSVSITAYFVMGTRVWISVTGEGTFSLDTQLGVWQMEFPEELRRLQGRAFFVPELGSVVGLTGGDGDDRCLCSYRLLNAGESGVPLAWQHTWSEAVPWECQDREYGLTREMVSLAYLGDCRFCVFRPVKMLGSSMSFNSFLVLELRRRRFPDGNEPEIAKRGAVVYIGLWREGPRGDYRDMYFLQH